MLERSAPTAGGTVKRRERRAPFGAWPVWGARPRRGLPANWSTGSLDMRWRSHPPAAHDKLLFTPGPLTTSQRVKQAMLCDAGSWHAEFNAKVKWIRQSLLKLARISRSAGYEAILLQGSGTFGVEAVFSTCVPPAGKVAVLANGAYGERMLAMLRLARIDHCALRTPED